jgi:hypothetical protein
MQNLSEEICAVEDPPDADNAPMPRPNDRTYGLMLLKELIGFTKDMQLM